MRDVRPGLAPPADSSDGAERGDLKAGTRPDSGRDAREELPHWASSTRETCATSKAAYSTSLTPSVSTLPQAVASASPGSYLIHSYGQIRR